MSVGARFLLHELLIDPDISALLGRCEPALGYLLAGEHVSAAFSCQDDILFSTSACDLRLM